MTTAEAMEQVRAAYQWILGREPDEAGLSYYTEQMSRGALDWPTLRRAMLDCEEFRGKRADIQLVELLDGVKIVLNSDDGDIGHAIAYHRCWEPHLTELLRTELRDGDVFLDIGGNVGVMSFVAARAVGPRGKVIAFEPNPTNAANYRRGIAANGFDNVSLHNFAVSDRDMTLTISSSTNAKASTGIDPLGTEEVIQALALDRFLAHEDRIDFIKIDIEGYELRAFHGMEQLLRRHRPKIQIEFNPICLEHQGGIDPAIFADLIFDLSQGPVSIIELDGQRLEIGSARDLMAEIGRRDAKAVEMGWLPAGWAHLDILMKVA